MKTKTDDFDFSRHKSAMIERFGYSEEDCEASWGDLLIILNAMERAPEKAFALTVGADQALHGLLLDTLGHLHFSKTIFGTGSIVVHDPFAYGTPEFAVAWDNTRAAFAEHGISLVENYRFPDPNTARNQAEMCAVSVQKIADMKLAA